MSDLPDGFEKMHSHGVELIQKLLPILREYPVYSILSACLSVVGTIVHNSDDSEQLGELMILALTHIVKDQGVLNDMKSHLDAIKELNAFLKKHGDKSE